MSAIPCSFDLRPLHDRREIGSRLVACSIIGSQTAACQPGWWGEARGAGPGTRGTPEVRRGRVRDDIRREATGPMEHWGCYMRPDGTLGRFCVGRCAGAVLSGENKRARLDRRAWYERAWPTTSGLEYERACRSTSRAGLLTTGTRTREPRDRSRVEESWPHRPHQRWRCPRHGSLNRFRPVSGWSRPTRRLPSRARVAFARWR